jgi:hypothetical protein
MKTLSTIHHIARDERGGAGLNMLWVCFLLIFLIPFLWDVASTQYARRFAGTGADGATLAAAQEYARRLHFVPQWNGIFRGRCELGEYRPQQVVLRYRTNPAFSAPPGLGQPAANAYASANRDELTAYRSYAEYSGVVNPAGVAIPVIKVYGEADRKVNTAYGPLYQREFKAPNQALAVAYLRRYTVTPRYCGDGRTTYDFTFEWKITMDAASI